MFGVRLVTGTSTVGNGAPDPSWVNDAKPVFDGLNESAGRELLTFDDDGDATRPEDKGE